MRTHLKRRHSGRRCSRCPMLRCMSWWTRSTWRSRGTRAGWRCSRTGSASKICARSESQPICKFSSLASKCHPPPKHLSSQRSTSPHRSSHGTSGTNSNLRTRSRTFCPSSVLRLSRTSFESKSHRSPPNSSASSYACCSGSAKNQHCRQAPATVYPRFPSRTLRTNSRAGRTCRTISTRTQSMCIKRCSRSCKSSPCRAPSSITTFSECSTRCRWSRAV